MKKAEKWIEYTKLMWEGVSLRKSAKALNITLRTSFRWRHMFIKAPASLNPSELTGVIETDETFLPESFKGKDRLSVNHVNEAVVKLSKCLYLLR
ncbi:MAG: hypothetical protein GY928_10315 [Colwellia sp.]|nr:hypothetical protein [Colwellia sp.]